MQYPCAQCMREVGANALEAECIIRGRRVMRLVCNDACLAALMSSHSANYAGRALSAGISAPLHGGNQSVLEFKYARDDFRVVGTCTWVHPRVTRHGVYCACGAGVLEVEWARRGRCAVCYYEAHPHEGICAKCGEYLGFKTVGDLCNQCRDRALPMAVA